MLLIWNKMYFQSISEVHIILQCLQEDEEKDWKQESAIHGVYDDCC